MLSPTKAQSLQINYLQYLNLSIFQSLFYVLEVLPQVWTA